MIKKRLYLTAILAVVPVDPGGLAPVASVNA